MPDPTPSAPPALESKTTAVGRPMRILANLLVVVTAVVGLVLLLVLLIGQHQRSARLADNQRELVIALAKTRKEAAAIATAQADRIKTLETRIQRMEQQTATGSISTTPAQPQAIDDILPSPARSSPEAQAAREAIVNSHAHIPTMPKGQDHGNAEPPKGSPLPTPADHPARMP